MIHIKIIDWLLQGAPAIRWQVHRDLLGSPVRVDTAERARVAREATQQEPLGRAGNTSRHGMVFAGLGCDG